MSGGARGFSAGALGRLVRRFARLRMPPPVYAAALCAAVLLRCFITYSQRAYLLPQSSPIDDMLMVRGAVSITGGEWLGAYGGMAIAKNMGFALWIALWHTLRVPLLWANAGLWLLCCGFAVRCMRPLFAGSAARLVLFCFLAFQPVSFAFFNQRAYRDAVFPSLCLLVFAGVAGFAVRAGAVRARGGILCCAGAGAGLAGALLIHEDSAVLAVFAVCGLAAGVLFGGRVKLAARLCCAALPFVIAALAGLAFAAANCMYYGVFVINDLTSGSFPAAYGAMAAVSEGESGWRERTPVTREALEAMLREVPALAPLSGHLWSGPAFNGFASGETGEYGGSFYYGLRLAAQAAGQTPGAPAAREYWRRVAGEIEIAVAENRLRSAAPGASVLPRWNAALAGPAAAETAGGFWAVMTFAGCDPRAAESIGPPELVAEVAEYLRVPVQTGYAEGTAQPYYGPLRTAAYAICDALVWLYRAAVWPLLALALRRMAHCLACGVTALFKQKKVSKELVYGTVLLGLLLSFVLRLAVAAYMETAAFGIGTYIMYLAGGVPALLLMCAAAAGDVPREESA